MTSFEGLGPAYYRESSLIAHLCHEYNQFRYLLDTLAPEDFEIRLYGDIYRVAMNLRDEGKPVGLGTLMDSVDGRLLDALIEANQAGTSASYDVEQTVARMKNAAKRRRIFGKLGNIISEQPEDPLLPLERVLEEERRDTGQSVSFAESATRFLDGLGKNIDALRIPTGFPRLDSTFGKLPLGSLTIVAARPGVGKTTFALNIALRAKRMGMDVMMASLEMSEDQIMERLAAMSSGVKYTTINQHRQSSQELEQVSEAMRLVDEYPGELIIYDQLYAVDAIIGQAARMRPKMLIVDFLQYMSTEKGETRARELAEVVRRFKQAARIYNMQVMVLSQLSRESEKFTRPTLAHLKESGAIEEGGDVIMLLHRPSATIRDGTHPPTYLEVIVAKNKFGITGVREFYFAGETQRITEVVKDGDVA